MSAERELLQRFVDRFDQFEDAQGKGETWQSEELTKLLDEAKALLAEGTVVTEPHQYIPADAHYRCSRCGQPYLAAIHV